MILYYNYHYGPSHPWFYHLGNEVRPATDVRLRGGFTWDEHISKDKKKAEKKRLELIEKLKESLKESENRYTDLQARGRDALSKYDRELGGNMSLPTALSLKNNHISCDKSRLHALGVPIVVTNSLSILDILFLI